MSKSYPAEAPANGEELWKIHEGIATRMTHRFHLRYPEVLTFDEKLSHACIAMLNCMKKWKPEYKTRFVTYAYYAIRRELNRAIAKELCRCKPGPIEEPGKYNIWLKNTNYQEGVSKSGGGRTGVESIHAELFAANQVTYQNPEDIIEAKQRIEMIRKKMPTKYRKAFKLMVEKGYTYGEAAVAQGISREAMRTVWNRCLKEMQDVLGN